METMDLGYGTMDLGYGTMDFHRTIPIRNYQNGQVKIKNGQVEDK